MNLYKFRFINGGELYSKNSNFNNVLKETKTALANKFIDYLHFIFSEGEFFPLYNLYWKNPSYGIITYDTKEKIVHIPDFYDYTIEYFNDKDEDENYDPIVDMLNENDKYTLEEISKLINYCLEEHYDLDSYGGFLELVIEPLIKCEVLDVSKNYKLEY